MKLENREKTGIPPKCNGMSSTLLLLPVVSRVTLIASKQNLCSAFIVVCHFLWHLSPHAQRHELLGTKLNRLDFLWRDALRDGCGIIGKFDGDQSAKNIESLNSWVLTGLNSHGMMEIIIGHLFIAGYTIIMKELLCEQLPSPPFNLIIITQSN
jgi:hypothetical protein